MPSVKWECKIIRYAEEKSGDIVKRRTHKPSEQGPRPQSFSVEALEKTMSDLGRDGWETRCFHAG
jgi:hypothetical protein